MTGPAAGPSRQPLFSIIVTNYNHAPFLSAAIDSSLEQTWPEIEVIVVDDGSTDGSLAIAEAYGDRVRLIAKPNGGHPSAMNHGFTASRGDVVLFLDSDDTLAPDIIARIAEVWTADAAKAHFYLQHMTSEGVPVEGCVLPPSTVLPRGDLRAMVRRFGLYPSPPTSGNAFSRRLLRAMMPLPTDAHSVDTLLIAAAPFFGEIVAIDGVGGFWRRHEHNMSMMDLTRLQRKLRVDLDTMRLISALPDGEGRVVSCDARWPQHLKECLLVEKFSGTGGMLRLARLAFSYVSSMVAWTQYGPGRRAAYVVWAASVLLLPRRILAAVPNLGGPNIRLLAR
jgi:glycosyltransferase involved in cell wall biosynthesis